MKKVAYCQFLWSIHIFCTAGRTLKVSPGLHQYFRICLVIQISDFIAIWLSANVTFYPAFWIFGALWYLCNKKPFLVYLVDYTDLKFLMASLFYSKSINSTPASIVRMAFSANKDILPASAQQKLLVMVISLSLPTSIHEVVSKSMTSIYDTIRYEVHSESKI